MSDAGYSCRNVGNVGNGMSGMSEMTCRMSDIHVRMSGMSGMSEMKRGSVGNVGIAKCECRDRVRSTVERFRTYVPIRGRRRTGSCFEYLSETGTNKDS